MRTTDAVLTALQGSTWFSVLDVVDGFFNLPLYPADRGYTAFHTPLGLFKWNVLPQGTAASPQLFQRMMDKWFSAYLWRSVIVWMDDLLVHSTTFEEHLQHLTEVFEVAKRYGIVFNRSKLKVAQRSVRYIGYIFGVDGIRTDPSKLQAVHTLPTPTSVKQVRQFLGFAGFYRRFMPPDYATVIAPLTQLTKKDQPFKWTTQCTHAFNKVKTLLTTTPVLTHPNFALPFHVHCDASGKGIGAVLSQYVDGAYRPIAFCSKRLLPHQLHWAPAQLEAYAVYYSICEKWRYYLTLNKTIVHTDHRNLSWLFKQSQKGMIGRWYAHLCAYDLDIVYVQGKTQVTADPLSRLLYPAKIPPQWAPDPKAKAPPVSSLLATIANGTNHLEPTAIYGQAWHSHPEQMAAFQAMAATLKPEDFNFVTSFLHPSDSTCNLSRSQWATAQRDDEHLGPIYSYLNTTSTSSPQRVPRWVKIAAQSYRLNQGLLQYCAVRKVGEPAAATGWVLAVPNKLRQAVLTECHAANAAGHRGVTKTTLMLRQRYHFQGLRKAVRNFISRCDKCIQAKSARFPKSIPLTPMFAPSPFLAIAIDIYKPGTTLPNGHKYVLTVVDMCTRWVHFVPLKTKFSAEVLLALCHNWFVIHGTPQFILSDRGKEFMGVVSTVCRATGIVQIRTTP